MSKKGTQKRRRGAERGGRGGRGQREAVGGGGVGGVRCGGMWRPSDAECPTRAAAAQNGRPPPERRLL
jgi:hypothetical protein